MMSPGTSFSAGTSTFSPPLIAIHFYGRKFLNPSINASAFADWLYVIEPVNNIIAMSIIAIEIRIFIFT